MNHLRAISIACLIASLGAYAQESTEPPADEHAQEAQAPEQLAPEQILPEDQSAIVEPPSTDSAQPPEEILDITEPDPLVEELNRQYERRAANSAQPGGLLGSAQTQPLIDLGRWVIAIFVVIALVLIAGFLARRFASKTPLLAGSDLGHVLGRIYLNRQAALYYVETGGRVLVVGVTNNQVSLVSEFDANAFDDTNTGPQPPSDAESFLSQLEQSARAMQGRAPATRAAALPDDMATMKRDIDRMRRMLADED